MTGRSGRNAEGQPPKESIRWALGLLPMVAMIATAVACIRPMATYRTLSLGGDAVSVGLVAGAFGLISFAAAIPIGRLIDRRSPRVFMLTGSALIAFAAAGTALADSLLTLGLSQAILGLGQIVTILGGQIVLASRATGRMRATWFGRYTLAASLGMFLGPTIGSIVVVAALNGHAPGSLVPDQVTDIAFVIAGLLAVGAFALTFAMPLAATAVEHRPDGPRPAMSTILAVPGMKGAMTASLAILIANDVVIAYLPVYGTLSAMPVSLIGILLVTLSGAAVLSRIGMGAIVRRAGTGRVLAAAIWVGAVSLALFPQAQHPLQQLVLVAAAGACFGLGQPITLLAVATFAPLSGRAAALGARLAGNRLGQALAPAAAGWISGASEVSSTFATMAIVLVIAGLSVGRAAPFASLDGAGEVSAVPAEE